MLLVERIATADLDCVIVLADVECHAQLISRACHSAKVVELNPRFNLRVAVRAVSELQMRDERSCRDIRRQPNNNSKARIRGRNNGLGKNSFRTPFKLGGDLAQKLVGEPMSVVAPEHLFD